MLVLSVAFAVGSLIVLVYEVPRLWGHRGTRYDTPMPYWRHSEAAWRGWVRGMPAGCVGAFLIGVAGTVGALGGHFEAEEPTLANGGWLVLAAALGAVPAVLVSLSALYLNVPKWAVPPHLRDQPGLVEEWRRAKKG